MSGAARIKKAVRSEIKRANFQSGELANQLEIVNSAFDNKHLNLTFREHITVQECEEALVYAHAEIPRYQTALKNAGDKMDALINCLSSVGGLVVEITKYVLQLRNLMERV